MSNDDECILVLEMFGVPFCVECLGCGHRSTVTPKAMVGDRPVDYRMTTLAAVSKRLRCSACGSRATKSFRPTGHLQTARFLDGSYQG